MSLDPLKFQVAIQDDATKQLGEIEKKFQELKDKTISVRVEGLQDLRSLLSALQHKQVETIGKDVASGIHDTAKGLQEEAQKAVRTLLGNLAKDLVLVKEAIKNDNFTAFSTRILKCAEVVNTLDEAFKKSHVTIGSDAGMKNFMTELGEVIKNVRTNIGSMEVIRNGGLSGLGSNKIKENLDKNTKSIAILETNQRRYNNVLADSEKLLSRLDRASTNGFKLGIDTTLVRTGARDVSNFVEKLLTFNNFSDSHGVSELIAQFLRLKTVYGDVAREQEKLNATTGKSNQKTADTTAKQAQKDNEKWAESMRTAGIEATKLEIQIRKLQDVESKAKSVGIDTSNLSAKIAELQSYVGILRSIEGGSKAAGHTRNFMGSVDVQNSIRLANEEAAAIRRAAQEKEKAVGATRQLSSEEQRLAQALNHTTESARGQSQVLSDLKSMATQYLGVWGGQQFLHNIIEIGGQLEMQRLSIGAILQNQGQANELFNQIKGLATQSPFGVVQLDQMTKQLTAYGFQYHELFDMTKRLADISAATGTDVSRLALALGHVRSEAALSGYTLRQFSMGNVPLLQKLAEKLGKTTKEIREMVKGKEISYDDVVGVLKDLTDDGGMFHNMQEVISESVKAKFKNVKDAMDIMYGEMAESGLIGGTLKEVASVLMTLTKNWRTVGAAIAGVVIPMTAYKLAMIAVNKGQITANIALGGFTAKQLEAQAVTGNLTRAQLLRAVASQKMAVADAEAAGAVLGLTRAQLMFVAKSGNISAAMNKASLAVSKYSVAQLRMLATAQQGGVFSTWVARTRIGLSSITAATKSVATAFLGLARSFLPLAAISAVFSLISRSVEASSKAVEMAKDIAEKARDSQKPIAEAFKEAEEDNFVKRTMTSNKVTNGQFVATYSLKFDEDALSKANLTDKIENLKEQLQNLSPMYEGDLLDINKAESQAEQYKIIMQKLESLRHLNDVNEATSDVLPNANKRVQGDNWFTRMFSDSFITDISDYDKRMKDSVEEINQINEVELDKIDKALNGKLTEIKNNLYLSSLNEALKLYFQQGSHLAGEEFSAFFRNLQSTQISNSKNLLVYYRDFTDPTTFGRSLDSQKKQLLGETEEIAKSMASTIKTYFENDPDGARYALRDFFNKMFTEAGTTDDMIMQETMNKILQDMTSYLPSGMQESVINEFQRKQVMEHFSKIINPDEIANAKTDKELDNLFNGYLEKIKAWAEVMNIDLKKLGLSVGGAFFGGFREAFDSKKAAEQLKSDWQKRAEQVFSKNTTIKGKISVETDMDVFAQSVQKDLKEKQEYLKRNAGHLRHTMHITSDVLVDAGKLKLLMDKLAMQAQKLAIQGKSKQAQSLMSKIQDELSPYYDALISVNEDKSWLKKEGYPEKDPTKGKKGSGGSKSDKELEMWRKRIQLLEKYRQELAQLEKFMTRGQAEAKLKSEGDFAPLWKYFSNPNDYKGSLDYVAKRLGTKGDRKSFVDELGAKKSAEDLRVFKENVSNAVSELDRLANVMAENYDTYKKWVDLTGDSNLAATIAGVSQNSSMAGWLTDKMSGELGKAGEKRSAQEVFGLSESEVKKFGENSAIYKLWNEWQENNKKIKKQNLDLYEEAIKNAKGYSERVADINRELEKEIAAIKEMTGGDNPTEEQQTQRDTLIKNATDNANKKIADETWKNFKATEEWGRIFADLDRISTGTLERMLAKLRQIAPTLNDSVESTKAVYEAIDRVQNVVNGRNPLRAISESLSKRKALGGYYKQAQQKGDLVANAELSKLLGVKLGSTVTKDQIKDGMKNESENFKKAIGKVVDGLQTFQNGLNFVSGVFDSLGMAGASNVAADASNILGGAMQGASALSALGPWGMAAGAGLGLIGGIAQTHDARLERQIAKLREDIQKIENNTALIVQARERTLGYDNGDVRRSYAQMYAPDDKQKEDTKAYWITTKNGTVAKVPVPAYKREGFKSQAQKDMYEYYSKNSSGTGYQQEYQNLLQQRKDYMDILSAQEGKKKKSQSDIDETKKKIAELDDQIMYFTQDLAKELWNIDIKGWADQISDALMSAFENGENAMKAFEDVSKSIMQSVAKEILKIAIIEPFFQELQDTLFGKLDPKTGERAGGIVDVDEALKDPASYGRKVADFTANFLKGAQEAMVTAGSELYYSMENVMNQLGWSLGNDSANTLSASVQGTSEETSSLLAAYLNAARQDISVNRILLTQFVTQLWPEYVESFAKHVSTVANINVNVQLMMEMMRDGSGALFNEVSSMRSRFDNVVDGIEKLAIR